MMRQEEVLRRKITLKRQLVTITKDEIRELWWRIWARRLQYAFRPIFKLYKRCLEAQIKDDYFDRELSERIDCIDVLLR